MQTALSEPAFASGRQCTKAERTALMRLRKEGEDVADETRHPKERRGIIEA